MDIIEKLDLVKRLRQGAYTDALDDILMKEAADEVERLRKENNLLKDRLWVLSNPARVAAGMKREQA